MLPRISLVAILFVTLVLCASANFRDVKVDNRYMPASRKALPKDERIIGGTEVTPNSIPYQVALFCSKNNNRYFCGGTLISANYVLTAGHCVDGCTNIEVIIGAHNIRDTSETTQIRMNSTKFHAHEKYNTFTLKNDIAMITLPSPAPLNNVINIVNLPSRSDVGLTYDGEIATISGWGKTSDEATAISDVLMSVQAPVLEWDECSSYYFPGLVTKKHVCVNSEGGQSSCNGDSGGPMTLNGVQIGIVSFGSTMGCESGSPAAFTRVTAYLDWIQSNSDVIIN